MKRLALVLCLLVLGGCAASSGRGSRLLPWNWFAPDRAGQLQQQQQQTGQREDQVSDAAHRDVAKTVRTLELDPAPNKYTQQALRFSRHGLGLLDQVRAIPFAEAQADQQLVQDLLSENAQIQLAAVKREAADNAKTADLARDLEKSRQREQDLTTKLQDSDRKYQAEAEQARRWKFWIMAAVGGWIVLQALSGLSRFYPGLAPLSRAASMVAAPALHAAYERVTTAAGRAIADAEKFSTAAAETIRQHLDDHMDAADQAAIKTKFETAPRTS